MKCAVLLFLSGLALWGDQTTSTTLAEVNFANYTNGGAVPNETALDAAVAALPPTGGTVIIPCSTSNYVFRAAPGTFTKPVMLKGCGGAGSKFQFNALSGNFLAWDPGVTFTREWGMEGIVLNGAINTSSAVGVTMGIANGAEGFTLKDSMIANFGIGLKIGNNTWNALVEHNMFLNNGVNMTYSASWSNSGEAMTFISNTFAWTTGDHASCVTINAPSQQTVFIGGGFDGCQLVTSGFVSMNGVHHESPNGPATVPYIVQNQPGSHLSLVNPDFLVAAFSGLTDLMSISAGSVYLNGGQAFSSQTALPALVNLSGSAAFEYGCGTITSNISALYSSTSTGAISMCGRLSAYTVGALPACTAASTGATVSVTDAQSASYLGALAGGGSVFTPAVCNGAAWVSY